MRTSGEVATRANPLNLRVWPGLLARSPNSQLGHVDWGV